MNVIYTRLIGYSNSALALKVLEKLTEIKDFEEASKSLTDKEKIGKITDYTFAYCIRYSYNLFEAESKLGPRRRKPCIRFWKIFSLIYLLK